jgi:hypothetical protein
MTGEEFYEEFKAALRYHAIDWGDRENMQVTIRDNKLVYSTDRAEIILSINPLPKTERKIP